MSIHRKNKKTIFLLEEKRRTLNTFMLNLDERQYHSNRGSLKITPTFP